MSTVAVSTSAARDAGPARSRTRAGRSPSRRRRAGVLVLLVVAAFLVTVAFGRVTAGADLADPVAGHAVVQPGQTLWDVAVATTPDGVDARQQLADLKALNGLEAADVDAWSVVLLPAR